MTKDKAAPEAAQETVVTSETTAPPSDAPTSLCADCALWDEGRCLRFRNVVEATEDPAPIIVACPDHTPESKA